MARKQRAIDFDGGLNLTDLAEALERPGNDPRTWVAYGTVRGGTSDDDPCVEFENDQPLVRVLLHPALREVRARVAMRTAGNGEAEWHPFMPGDEVLVVIPNGHERAGACIVGKLCNAIDKFPEGSIAGQDPRKNNFAFRRTKTPTVEELNGPVMLRSAKTGGFISIDDAGVLTLRGGNPDDPNAAKPAPGLQMSADGISMQDASAKYALSFGPTAGAFLALIGDAVLSLSSSDGPGTSMIGVPTSLAIGTGGQPPLEHVATTESVFGILQAIMLALGAALNATGPTPLTGTSAGTVFTTFATVGLAGVIPAAATTPLNPLTLAAIISAFAAAVQKPNTPAGQLAPGLGCPSLLVG